MTVNELVETIADDLGLTSPEAKQRITREINVRYKRVTSAIGLTPSRRVQRTTTATIGSNQLTFTDIEKLDTVFRVVGTESITLDELTDDEMVNEPPRDEPPTKYSVYTIGPTSIIIQVDCVATTAYTLYAHGLSSSTTLSNNDQPGFPESFHDILEWGVKADEYRRKEKSDLAQDAENTYETRLSDLRMFLAKSTYLDIHRGKHADANGWWDNLQYH